MKMSMMKKLFALMLVFAVLVSSFFAVDVFAQDTLSEYPYDTPFTPTHNELRSTKFLEKTAVEDFIIFDYSQDDYSIIVDALKRKIVSWGVSSIKITITVTPETHQAMTGKDDSITFSEAADFWSGYIKQAYLDAENYYKAFDDGFWTYYMVSHAGLTWGSQWLRPGNSLNEYEGVYKIVFTVGRRVKNSYDQEQEVRERVEEMFSPGGVFYECRRENDLKTDYEKIVTIWKWIGDNIKYGGSHTNYGALFKGETVCDGYSATSGILLWRAGVDVRCIYGSVPAGTHAWNWVKLADKWYLYDSTGSTQASAGPGMMLAGLDTYKYYKTDDGFDDGTFNTSSTDYPYDWRGGNYNQLEAVDSGSIGDNLRWKLENGTLTISGEGDMRDFESAELVPWKNYFSDIKRLVIENGVTSIGSYAFYNASALTYAEYKDKLNNVKSIGKYAFYDMKEEIIISCAHDYSFCRVKYLDSGNELLYICEKCDNEITHSQSEVGKAFQSFINKRTADIENGYIYDAYKDGYINARDFAKLTGH